MAMTIVDRSPTVIHTFHLNGPVKALCPPREDKRHLVHTPQQPYDHATDRRTSTECGELPVGTITKFSCSTKAVVVRTWPARGFCNVDDLSCIAYSTSVSLIVTVRNTGNGSWELSMTYTVLALAGS